MSTAARTIAVVTGTRAEFGLLKPVMEAIKRCNRLRLKVIAAGSHVLSPDQTIHEVRAAFDVDEIVPMQQGGKTSRIEDSKSLGRGVIGFAEAIAKLAPDVVIVLGDRIEAFAAAAAASVAGVCVGHIHGGDRAEGIADEAMRHAISKLSHLHFPATATSAQRLIAMGEDPSRVHMVGSPAVDSLESFESLTDSEFAQLGSPSIVVLLHPIGDDEAVECARAHELLKLASGCAPTLALHPNHDASRDGIVRAIEQSSVRSVSHLPRSTFTGLLRRAHVLLGNSSAGLIECAAIGTWCINVGLRQAGREMPENVINIADCNYGTIARELNRLMGLPRPNLRHPYGDGKTGERIAGILASIDLDPHILRKRNTY